MIILGVSENIIAAGYQEHLATYVDKDQFEFKAITLVYIRMC